MCNEKNTYYIYKSACMEQSDGHYGLLKELLMMRIYNFENVLHMKLYFILILNKIQKH